MAGNSQFENFLRGNLKLLCCSTRKDYKATCHIQVKAFPRQKEKSKVNTISRFKKALLWKFHHQIFGLPFFNFYLHFETSTVGINLIWRTNFFLLEKPNNLETSIKRIRLIWSMVIFYSKSSNVLSLLSSTRMICWVTLYTHPSNAFIPFLLTILPTSQHTYQ